MLHLLSLTFALAPLGTGLVAAGAHTPGAPGLVVRAAPQPTSQDAGRFARRLIEEAGDDEAARHLPSIGAGQRLTSGCTAGGSALGSTSLASPAQVNATSNSRIFEVTIHPGAGYTEKFLVAPASPGSSRA